VLALCAVTWGVLIEPGLLRVERVTIETEEWPTSLPPLRVVAIADLHAGGQHVDSANIDRLVAEANALAPDLIVLLGDYVIEGVVLGKPMSPEEIARHLASLHAPLGVFAVLGNHDWDAGGDVVRRALEDVGIVVLDNHAVPLSGTADRVWLAGIADDSTRRPDPRVTFATIPDGVTVITLTHDPGIFPEVPARSALTLAGHTHGGQVAVPFFGALYVPGRAPLRYARGHIHEKGEDLFVSSGIGTSMVPMRFAVPPEIVLLTLRAPGE
jgi:uncharacterized protein